jgi:hypothetical protein
MTRLMVDQKTAIIREIAILKGGVPISDLVSEYARRYGVSPRTIYRWLGGSGIQVREPAGLKPDMWADIARHQGNLQRTWQEHQKSGCDYSYRTFVRRFHNSDTMLQAGVLDGVPAAIAKAVYNTFQDVPKMALLHMDHKQIPISVIDEKTGEIKKVWATKYVDRATRYVFPIVITEGEGVGGDPNSESVIAGMAQVLIGEDVDGVHVGGEFKVLQLDNALAHSSEALTNGASTFGVMVRFIPRRMPWRNGIVERVNRTYDQEFYNEFVGFTRASKPFSGELWTADDLSTVDELELALEEFRIHYNTTRPHSALGGRTPLQAWIEEDTEIRQVDHALVRHAFMAEERPRSLSKNGVRFRGIDYVHPTAFHGHVGRKVNVRYLPNDRSFIAVYLGGQFLCEAHPAKHLTQEQRFEIARITRRRIAQVDRIMKTGAKRAKVKAMRQTELAKFTDPDAQPVLDEETDLLLQRGEQSMDEEGEA